MEQRISHEKLLDMVFQSVAHRECEHRLAVFQDSGTCPDVLLYMKRLGDAPDSNVETRRAKVCE